MSLPRASVRVRNLEGLEYHDYAESRHVKKPLVLLRGQNEEQEAGWRDGLVGSHKVRARERELERQLLWEG